MGVHLRCPTPAGKVVWLQLTEEGTGDKETMRLEEAGLEATAAFAEGSEEGWLNGTVSF